MNKSQRVILMKSQNFIVHKILSVLVFEYNIKTLGISLCKQSFVQTYLSKSKQIKDMERFN